LPASRQLAAELGVSRGRVVEAYTQLAAEGYLYTQRGSGTRVATVATPLCDRRDSPLEPRIDVDLRPGTPSLAHFPRSTWLRCLRRAFDRAPDSVLASYDARGVEHLRLALARYINRARGTVADPGRIVICSGAMQGVTLLARALRASGAERVAVEDPGYPFFRAAIQHHGLLTIGIPVDREGIDVEALGGLGADAAIVTPAHQFPSGVVLSPCRRSALLDWARARGALVIEDDYDGEFRYDRQPVGTLQGLAPELVAYLGSASKLLAPALRLGWLALPDALVEAVAREKALDDLGTDALVQLAFAEFIESTGLDRHLRRMRRLYQARRDALIEALAENLPGAEVRGVAAGLQVLVMLPPGSDEAGVVASAFAQGVALVGLSEYSLGGKMPEPALVVGYANATESAIVRGVAEIARSVELVQASSA
jgi:GntR family transcriptional regulator / MocR family aminotransferase